MAHFSRLTRALWPLTTALLLGAQSATCASTTQTLSRPNIVFIMSDDHAAPAISCYGGKLNQTPNIDRLAKEGMRFNNCFCTNGICAPSRAVILTGKYSHVNGLRDNNDVFDATQVTFPKLLQKAGYQTGLVGKWHLKSLPTGFDYYNILVGQGAYFNPPMIENGKRGPHKGYVTDLITSYSIGFMEQRDKNKPFLLMCHHKAPHREWEPDAKHAKLYENLDMPIPSTFDDDYSSRSAASREATMRIERDLTPKDLKQAPPQGLSAQELKKWKYQRYIKDYLRVIASVDDSVGQVLDYLDKNGLAENTVVVYTSDQGFFLGDHGWFDKRFMYDEALRMPFLVRWPKKIQPKSQADAFVINADFAPTFLELAGAGVPAEMQGRSFSSVLEGKTPPDWRKSVYYQYYEYPQPHSVHPHYGVRTQDFKLIRFFQGMDEWELFDLKKDPDELESVYADPAYAKTVETLKAELKRLREQYRATSEGPQL